MLNSLKVNKKRVLAKISSEDVRSDKMIKGDNSNALDVDGKVIDDTFLKPPDNVQK